MSKEVRNGQQQEAGGIIGHGIGRTVDDEVGVVILMVSLVHCLHTEEVGRVAGGCRRGTVTLPANGSNIVGSGRNGLLADVKMVSCNVLLKDRGSSFQI